ncbi:MAG: hypothetical protein JXJ04_14580, partial [Spirochaetales bacterium]|nr:hypothetical protein [Spirochaetales bacterium]
NIKDRPLFTDINTGIRELRKSLLERNHIQKQLSVIKQKGKLDKHNFWLKKSIFAKHYFNFFNKNGLIIKTQQTL